MGDLHQAPQVGARPRLGRPLRLSKSRYLAGLRCTRRLWWQSHEPDAEELRIGPSTEAIFRQGTRVGRVARDHMPGGVLIDFDWRRRWQGIEATRQAIARGERLLYEAAFEADGICVVVDILGRHPSGWTLTEVKSTTQVRDDHIDEVALQAHVLRAAGLRVERMELMHLNRKCRYPDLRNLFRRVDITEQVELRLPELPRALASQRAMLDGPVPRVEPGSHCQRPYACPFIERCSPRPAPASGEPKAEPSLAAALAELEPPLAYLDFETIWPAIPVFDGCRPYDQVPVQLSVHVEGGDRVEHREWLADGPGDPREQLADQLLAATRDAATVLAWYAPFERERIRELAAALPHRADELLALEARTVDLLCIVRDHVHHPGFGGRHGLKHVLPLLVPGLGYDDLEVTTGGDAMGLLEDMLLRGEPDQPSRRAEMRRHLLRYCERDTWALVMIMRRLRALVMQE